MPPSNKLSRYFGIDVKVTEQVDPRLLIGLKERADRFANRVGFDPEEHFVYIHSLVIAQTNSAQYFARNTPIDKRIEKLHATFKINPKQARNPGKEQIRFIDAYMMDDAKDSWLDSTTTTVDWEYPGSFLIGNRLFLTNIITWVSKEIRRPDFKKIKLLISAQPTASFSRRLLKSIHLDVPTAIDVPLTFAKDIRFLLSNISEEERIRLRNEYLKIEKVENKQRVKTKKTVESIRMNEKERSDQPLISIGGNVTTLQVIANSSSFTANQLGQDGATLSTILGLMLEAVQSRIPESEDRKKLEDAIVTASNSSDKGHFLENYKRIIALAKPTYEILSDFIPRLTQFL